MRLLYRRTPRRPHHGAPSLRERGSRVRSSPAPFRSLFDWRSPPGTGGRGRSGGRRRSAMRGRAIWLIFLTTLVDGLSDDVSSHARVSSGFWRIHRATIFGVHTAHRPFVRQLRFGPGRCIAVARDTCLADESHCRVAAAINALRGGWGGFGNDPLYELLGLKKSDFPSDTVSLPHRWSLRCLGPSPASHPRISSCT
jgi:hypothetical protein